MVKIKQDLLKKAKPFFVEKEQGSTNANKTLSTDANGNVTLEAKNNHTHAYVPTANVKNDLTTGGSSNVLSAEQGKTLNNNKLDKTSYVDTFANLKTLMTNVASTTGGIIVLDRDYKAASGDGYFTLSDNKILTIIGNGHTLDLNNITRFCNVNSGSTLNLVDFKIVRGNSTSYSGVIWNAGILKLENCVFADNTCVTSGGVMDMNGSTAVAIISNCIFANNKATGSTAIGGALALVAGSMFITNSDFINNSSYDGGAITNKATMKIWNSNFTYNTASHYGGAINSTNANLAVYDTVFTNNTGGTSNSIYSSAALTIYNCTLDTSSPTTNVTHRTYSLDNHTHAYVATSQGTGNSGKFLKVNTSGNVVCESVTIPTNTNQLTNGAGFTTATGHNHDSAYIPKASSDTGFVKSNGTIQNISVSQTKTTGIEIGSITIGSNTTKLYQQDNNTTYSLANGTTNGLSSNDFSSTYKTYIDNLVKGQTYATSIYRINNNTDVTPHKDLNNDKYKVPGIYYCEANATVQLMSNTPWGNTPSNGQAFALLVLKHAGVRQILMPYGTSDNNIYVRNFYNNAWSSSWTKISLDGHTHNYIPSNADGSTTGNLTATTSGKGVITANKFIVNGGTSGHFLKVDGSTAAANNYSHPSGQQCTHTHTGWILNKSTTSKNGMWVNQYVNTALGLGMISIEGSPTSSGVTVDMNPLSTYLPADTLNFRCHASHLAWCVVYSNGNVQLRNRNVDFGGTNSTGWTCDGHGIYLLASSLPS